jgi:hypothetical protein
MRRLDALTRRTPVRGVAFDEHYPHELGQILASPGGQRLVSVTFTNGPERAIEGLAGSPATRALERVRIQNGLTSDANALALAAARFKRLRRLDLAAYCGVTCSEKSARGLLDAPWFRKLEQVLIGFSEDCCQAGMRCLAGMPRLHSLALWILPTRQLLALSRAGEFPALRRLLVYAADLRGKHTEALARMKAPKLTELWLTNSKLPAAEIRRLAASPLFANLRVLTLQGTELDEKSLEYIAESECAELLRVLRIGGNSDCVGQFRSLAASPLARTGAFPSLTTLDFNNSFQKKSKRDTAKFLQKLATPRLRHLTLRDCDFDDVCAEAIAANATSANLTRLHLEQCYDSTRLLSPDAATRLFRSPSLRNLVELELHNFAVGPALAALEDESTLPNLSRAAFWGSGAAPDAIARLKKARPRIHVGS